MTPKINPDEDGDIPPCSVMYSIGALNDWEHSKQSKYEFKVRKAPCSCRYFDGSIPSNHKCFVPIKQSKLKSILIWLKNALSLKYVRVQNLKN